MSQFVMKSFSGEILLFGRVVECAFTKSGKLVLRGMNSKEATIVLQRLDSPLTNFVEDLPVRDTGDRQAPTTALVDALIEDAVARAKPREPSEERMMAASVTQQIETYALNAAIEREKHKNGNGAAILGERARQYHGIPEEQPNAVGGKEVAATPPPPAVEAKPAPVPPPPPIEVRSTIALSLAPKTPKPTQPIEDDFPMPKPLVRTQENTGKRWFEPKPEPVEPKLTDWPTGPDTSCNGGFMPPSPRGKTPEEFEALCHEGVEAHKQRMKATMEAREATPEFVAAKKVTPVTPSDKPAIKPDRSQEFRQVPGTGPRRRPAPKPEVAPEPAPVAKAEPKPEVPPVAPPVEPPAKPAEPKALRATLDDGDVLDPLMTRAAFADPDKPSLDVPYETRVINCKHSNNLCINRIKATKRYVDDPEKIDSETRVDLDGFERFQTLDELVVYLAERDYKACADIAQIYPRMALPARLFKVNEDMPCQKIMKCAGDMCISDYYKIDVKLYQY